MVLPAPRNFRFTQLPALGIQFWWDAVPGAATYSVFIDGAETVSKVTSTASAPSCGARMQPGLPYYCQVRAVDANGVPGELSEYLPVTTTVIPALGVKHIHVQMLTFSDVEGVPYNEDTVYAKFNALSQWYAKQSFGKFFYSFSISGWRNAPQPLSTYVQRVVDNLKPDEKPPWQMNGGLWYGVMRPTIGLKEVRDVFALDAGSPDMAVWVVNGCGEVGFGDCYAARWLSVSTLMHEFGHWCGLQHAGDLKPRSPETRRMPERLDLTQEPDPQTGEFDQRWFWSRYGHPGDPMNGDAGVMPMQFCASNRLALGWIPLSTSRQAIPGSSYYLTPVDAPLSRPGTRELRVDMGMKGVYLSIDYRSDVDGVMIVLKHPLKGPPDTSIQHVSPDQNPTMKVGQSFVDDFRRLKITRTTSLLPGYARIKVERI